MPQANKKKTLELASSFCEGFGCDWAITKSGFDCIGGGGGCLIANFVEAEESYFHPPELIEATTKIRRILSKIPPDEKGRKLSFCLTEMGVFLAWCSHTGRKKPARAVTRYDSREKVAKALKLIVKK
jgi:hypothetical protein